MTIPARPRLGGAPIVMIVCGVLGFSAEGAAGKPRRADLKVSGATLSAAPAAGARVIVRATVRNAGKAAAGRRWCPWRSRGCARRWRAGRSRSSSAGRR